MAATITLTDSDTYVVGGATHSYTLDIGALGSADDGLVLCIGARSISGLTSISSVAIAGVAATAMSFAIQDEGGGIKSAAAIYGIRRGDMASPADTSVAVSVVFNTSTLRGAADIYVLEGAALAPFAVADWGDLDAAPIDVSLNTALDGAAVGCCYDGDALTHIWTGLTEQTEVALPGPNAWSSAALSPTAAVFPLTVQVAVTGAHFASAAVAVSFEALPPPAPPTGTSPIDDVPLNVHRGGSEQVPLLGDSWTAGDPYVIPDGTVRDTIQPGTNSPRIKGIGWRRAMRRLRQAKGLW